MANERTSLNQIFTEDITFWYSEIFNRCKLHVTQWVFYMTRNFQSNYNKRLKNYLSYKIFVL